MLDQLDAERELHGRWTNLVVMATGTGKTVVAALDYERLRALGDRQHLLFVAHRKEILDQSLATFRHVMRDGAFGEQYVDGAIPRDWQHVFASIQSLTQLDLDRLAPDHFSMVIVDEFHHAEAPTYRRLLEHLRPQVLVGLTATPERTDGEDVRGWFDGRIAVELRLWEAMERGLLSPFQYFGVARRRRRLDGHLGPGSLRPGRTRPPSTRGTADRAGRSSRPPGTRSTTCRGCGRSASA